MIISGIFMSKVQVYYVNPPIVLNAWLDFLIEFFLYLKFDISKMWNKYTSMTSISKMTLTLGNIIFKFDNSVWHFYKVVVHSFRLSQVQIYRSKKMLFSRKLYHYASSNRITWVCKSF